MTWKSYAAVSGAGLLATYLVSSPPAVTPGRAPVRQAAATSGAAETFDIADEASRLQAQVPRAVEYDEPSRNPFRFGARQAARPAPPVEALEQDAPPAAVDAPILQPPSLRVAGIAVATVDGERIRTAILITPDGAVEVREGATVGGRYRVTRIDDTAVELADRDGRFERLPLRP